MHKEIVVPIKHAIITVNQKLIEKILSDHVTVH